MILVGKNWSSRPADVRGSRWLRFMFIQRMILFTSAFCVSLPALVLTWKKGKFAPKQRHINIYPAHCSPTHKLIEGGNISPDEAPLNVASTTATAAAVFETSTMLLLLAYRTINRLLLHKHPMLLADPACSPLLGDGLLAVKTYTHTPRLTEWRVSILHNFKQGNKRVHEPGKNQWKKGKRQRATAPKRSSGKARCTKM